MGIRVEFNPDLALRAYGALVREERECLPKKLKEGEVYEFLKEGQRNYWLQGEIPLLRTKGNGNLSRPLASITILNANHFLKGDKVYTEGKYRVNRIFDENSSDIHFEGFNRVK